MSNLKVGDIVARKSYGCDIFFKVASIQNNGTENIVTIKGITYRIQADALESDLIVQSDKSIDEYNLKVCQIINQKLKNVRTLV